MGFIEPAPPPFDVEEWRKGSHLEKIEPLAQDWAVNGFGTPYFVYLLYLVKIARLRGRRPAADLGDDLRPRRARQPRRLVDRTDRLPEGGRLDDALGDPRPRRRLAAADAALQADDRRRPLLAAAGDHAPAALARPGAADAGDDADAARRRDLRGGPLLARLPAGHRRRPGDNQSRRPARPGRGRHPARAAGPARPARQGPLPRRRGRRSTAT